MATCLVALGSNLGDRHWNLDRAIELLEGTRGIRVVARSRYHTTPPIGGPPGQGSFLNAAAKLQTQLTPRALFDVFRHIERQLDRSRVVRWSARTIDLDLLLYDQQILRTEQLVVPHPRMTFRRFVLEPAVEIAPDMVHPQVHWTLSRLLRHLDESPRYVAVAGAAINGRRELGREIHERFGGRLIEDPVHADDRLASTASPAGQPLQAEIRLLECRALHLMRAADVVSHPVAPERTSQALLVSDFWFHESLARARCVLEGDALARFADVFRASLRRVPAPRLIVLTGVGTDAPLAPRAGPEHVAAATRQPTADERLQQEIVAEASAGGHGPMLWLGGHHAADRFDEVVAAIQAMDASHVIS